MNSQGVLNTFYLCLKGTNSTHVCDNANIPFEKWYKSLALYKTCCGKTNNTVSWENKTDLSDCDQDWQMPLAFKYKSCNYSSIKLIARVKNSKLIEPSFFQVIIWIMAALAVLGNGAVFVSTSKKLNTGWSTMSEVLKVHHFGIANLSLADFLMGIYLTCIAAVAAAFNGYDGRKKFVAQMSAFCDFLGVLSLVSSQMSVSVLLVMTSFRLYSVTHPYKRVSPTKSSASIISLWVFWIFVAFVPLWNLEATTVAFETVLGGKCGLTKKTSMFTYYNIKQILDAYLERVTNLCKPFSNHTMTFPNGLSGSQALSIAQHLKLVNNDPQFFSYYRQQNLCTPMYFAHGTNDARYYGMSLLIFNLTAFLYIFVAYWLIAVRTSGTESCLFCCGKAKTENLGEMRERENRQLYCKVMLIVVSDFLCWMPTSVLGLAYTFSLYNLQHPDTCDAMLNLVFPKSIFTMFVLPINSAVNPLLHSGVLLSLYRNIQRLINERPD